MEKMVMYKSSDGKMFALESECEAHEIHLWDIENVKSFVSDIQKKLVAIEYDINRFMDENPQFSLCLFVDNSRLTKPTLGFNARFK